MEIGRGEVKKRPRAFTRSKFPVSKYSIDRGNSLKPKWKDIPLSNLDLMDWVDYLKIPDFKGIFARDSPDHLHQTGCCIINLDDGVGNERIGLRVLSNQKLFIILIRFHCLRPLNLWIMRGDWE